MKITTMQAILKFKKIHENKYDYSKVNYQTAKDKIIIICKEHGEFTQSPNNHLNGNGCPKCHNQGYTSKEKLKNWLKQIKKVHGNKYDYSLIKQITNGEEKVSIICPIHGIFKQSVQNHKTNGCPPCGKLTYKIKRLLSKEQFIEKAISTHGNKYDYSKVNYIGAHKKVSIICPTHGEFIVTPVNHWSNGIGCISCHCSNPSKGESKILKWLEQNNIEYEFQKSFKNLYYKSSKGRLKYDFYLPKSNLLIEYDGEHHFIPISWSKDDNAIQNLKEVQIRDELKNKYAKNNNFKLLRIQYNQEIEKILEKEISY